tara:strand:- start:217 stop:372 length:156 start_codon:yes stop_codon:yes gene_type:complete
MPSLEDLNEFQVKSLLTKNYMGDFDLIEHYDITFNSNGSRAKINIIFKEVK